MSSLVLSNIQVNTNEDGLYRLNDLHKASGGEKRHAPNEWLRNQQTRDLIDEVDKPEKAGLKSIQKRGTYACKELVYAYAMWISPKFHLKVIRAFDALVSGDIEGAHAPSERRNLSTRPALGAGTIPATPCRLPFAPTIIHSPQLDAEL